MAKPSKIRAAAHSAGIPVRDLLIALYQRHGSQRAVADALEIAPSTVSNHLKIEGLKEFAILVSSSATSQEKAS